MSTLELVEVTVLEFVPREDVVPVVFLKVPLLVVELTLPLCDVDSTLPLDVLLEPVLYLSDDETADERP